MGGIWKGRNVIFVKGTSVRGTLPEAVWYFHVTWHIFKYWEIGGIHLQRQHSEINRFHPVKMISKRVAQWSRMSVFLQLSVWGFDKNSLPCWKYFFSSTEECDLSCLETEKGKLCYNYPFGTGSSKPLSCHLFHKASRKCRDFCNLCLCRGNNWSVGTKIRGRGGFWQTKQLHKSSLRSWGGNKNQMSDLRSSCWGLLPVLTRHCLISGLS